MHRTDRVCEHGEASPGYSKGARHDRCRFTGAWSASYLARDKTNNYAERVALAAGVRECAARYQPQRIRLHIIGDSRLVLHHKIETATIKTRALRRTSNLSAQSLGLYPYLPLSDTLRAGNTMVDHLANLAMDDQHSTEASTAWTPTDDRLMALLSSNTTFALNPITRRPSSDLFQNLEHILTRQQQQPPD